MELSILVGVGGTYPHESSTHRKSDSIDGNLKDCLQAAE
jgi:hypothetical protein